MDMRLRPNGQNGLSVSSFDMFSRYQRNTDGNGAWPWEHQALTRARFCAGDPDIGRKFEAERAYILQMPRDEEKLKRDVVDMRAKMLEGHPNCSALFDIKHDRGGMVDIEFAVQKMVLAASREHPELINNFGNTLLLEMTAKAGLIRETTAAQAVKAYRRYRDIQREVRLGLGAEGGPVRVEPGLVCKEAEDVKTLWREVFGTDEPQRA